MLDSFVTLLASDVIRLACECPTPENVSLYSPRLCSLDIGNSCCLLLSSVLVKISGVN